MILILILKIINDRTIKIDFEEFSCLLNRRKTSNEKCGSVSSVNSRAFAAKSSCEISKFQLRAFSFEFNQWGRVKEGRGADESNAEFSVKLFQNQIVDSYGNTQDVKISRKLNSKSFYLLFTEGVTIDEWTRGVWSLIQTEIRSNRFSRGNSIFRIFFRNFHDCTYYR